MALYDNGRFLRVGRPLGSSRARPHGVLVFALVFTSGAALAFSELEPALVAPLRAALSGPLAPAAAVIVDGVAAISGGLFALKDLLAAPFLTQPRLAADDARRAVLEARIVDLERENRDLKALTRYSRAPKPQLVSARVVMSSASPLSQTIMLDAGRNQGVRGGHPVVAGDGLVGRVVQAYPNQSSVMLLTDRLSRVPVAVGAAQVHAVLAGSGDGSARLEFIGPGASIQPGDLVTTSGAGGVFPRGLGVGVVAQASTSQRVELTAWRDDPLAVGVLLLDGVAFDVLDPAAAKVKPGPGNNPQENKP